MKPQNQITPDTLLIILLSLVFPIRHQAQSARESMYSDQAIDPGHVQAWYLDPILWIGAVLVVVVVVFWWKRRR